MERSTQTNKEMDRQPLWALLAEEEFLWEEEELSTDTQRQRRSELVRVLVEDQQHEALARVRQREAMWLWQIEEHGQVAHLTPPTTHRSIQRADLFTACRHATLRMQMDRIVRGRHDNAVWSDTEAHASARQAVESAQGRESLRRRGENDEDIGSDCSVKTEKGPNRDDARAKLRGRSSSRSRSPPPSKREIL